jgi:2,4-dienoyl-CoA reductase-like NADH-dependent reductase (Old Yellow Enzyme family)
MLPRPTEEGSTRHGRFAKFVVFSIPREEPGVGKSHRDSPMTRSHSPGGVPGDDVARYYTRRAENDVGLIITEGTVVDHPSSANDPNVPRLFGAAALAGWPTVAEAVHAAGGRIIPQLWHVGSVRNPAASPNPDTPSVGRSGLRKPAVTFGDPMSESEIADVRQWLASMPSSR